jgi:hypothetical protein
VKGLLEHVAGPVVDQVQRCTRCYAVLTDTRGAVVASTDPRPITSLFWAEGDRIVRGDAMSGSREVVGGLSVPCPEGVPFLAGDLALRPAWEAASEADRRFIEHAVREVVAREGGDATTAQMMTAELGPDPFDVTSLHPVRLLMDVRYLEATARRKLESTIALPYPLPLHTDPAVPLHPPPAPAEKLAGLALALADGLEATGTAAKLATAEAEIVTLRTRVEDLTGTLDYIRREAERWAGLTIGPDGVAPEQLRCSLEVILREALKELTSPQGDA